jgi:hypothetical protein
MDAESTCLTFQQRRDSLFGSNLCRRAGIDRSCGIRRTFPQSSPTPFSRTRRGGQEFRGGLQHSPAQG